MWTNTQKTAIGFIGIIAIFSLALAAWALGSSSSTKSDGRGQGITVSDSAVVKAKPDTAYVTLGVANSNRSAKIAASDNARKTTAVINALIKSGISKSAIKTVDYSLYPQMNYDSNPPKVTGYRASNQVRVKLKDMSRVADVIDTAARAGANTIDGIRFAIENKDSLRHKALAKAVKKARGKAEAIADALGVNLGAPRTVSESLNEYGSYMAAEVATKMPLMRRSAAAVSTPINPDDVSVSADITISYAIR